MLRLLHRARPRAALFGLTLALAPAPAFAEWFLDFYGGIAQSRGDDAKLEEQAPFFASPETLSVDADFDSSVTLGGRIGYWFPSYHWLGLALDVSHFSAEGDTVDIEAVPITPLLMVRWPLLVGDGFPHGRLQPYAGIGPTLFSYELEIDTATDEKLSELGLNVGLDVRAGLAWQLTTSLALFGEYRFTHVTLEVEEKGCLTFDCAVFFPFAGGEDTRRTAEVTLDTHHFLMGLSYRF